MTHLADGFAHTAFDDLVAVLTPIGQALAQRLLSRRQNEDRACAGHQFANLLGALPVDLQNQVMTFVQRLLQTALRGPVHIAEDFSLFEKIAVLDHAHEFGAIDEVVVHAVHFARTHGPGGVGHRHADLRLSVDQGVDQAGLARA